MKRLLTFVFVFSVVFLSYSQNEWEKVGYTQSGKASFYANKFHGRKTASGEMFDMYAMTGAHPLIPFNSIVKVTNVANGKWVTVRINDRGPFSKTRIIDVSKAAALKLDMVQDGTIDVTIELLRVGIPEMSDADISDTTLATPIAESVAFPSKKDIIKEEVAAQEKKEESTSTVPIIPEGLGKVSVASVPLPEADKIPEKNPVYTDNKPKEDKKTPVYADKKPVKEVKKVDKPTGKSVVKTSEKTKKEDVSKPTTTKPTTTTGEKPLTTASSSATPAINTELAEKFKPVNTYSVWGTPKKASGYALQIGTYSDITTAIALGKEAISKGLEEIYIQAGYTNKQPVYRVLFGAKPTEEAIKKELVFVKAKGYNDAFVREHFK